MIVGGYESATRTRLSQNYAPESAKRWFGVLGSRFLHDGPVAGSRRPLPGGPEFSELAAR
jgi:hypothetical protein